MEFRDRKLCTLEGVVFNSCAIQSSLRPSSTQRRIFDACGFKATLLAPIGPSSFDDLVLKFICTTFCYPAPDVFTAPFVGEGLRSGARGEGFAPEAGTGGPCYPAGAYASRPFRSA